MQKAEIGKPAPVLGAIDLNGNPVKISELKGKITVLNFWTGGCAPCLTEIPVIQKFYKTHEKDGIRVLSVNVGGGEKIVKDAIRETGVSFDFALDDLSVAAMRYGVIFFPTTFIVDKNGVVREKIVGELRKGTLEQKVSSLLE